MAWAAVMIAMLFVQACVLPVYGYGEPDSSGHPSYSERANHVFLNAARVDPSGYKSLYMSGYSPSPASILGSRYPPVAPLYLEPKLVNSAYFHSNELATVSGCAFQHNSCDGTDTFTRIKKYYTCSGTMGENIAAGNVDPLDTNNQWLCDQTGGACAGDGSGSDGHRSNIMGSGFKVVGTGFASGSNTYKNYWTQDFGGASCSPAPTSPVYGGSHRVKSGTTKFVAVYYSGSAPSSAQVVVAGTAYTLTKELGAFSGAGVYSFSQTSGTACRSYYFQFGSVRYPETGCLSTFNEGSCTQSFDSSCSGNGATVATAATATTAAATTTTTTTAAAVTTTTTTTTTGTATTGTTGSNGYYVYTTSLQNGWTIYGTSVVHGFTYSGRTGLSVSIPGNGKFTWFDHSPAINNQWSSVVFYAAATTNTNILVYFNGGVYQNKAVTTGWQFFSIPMSSLGSPAQIGSGHQLVFQNAASLSFTLYLSSVGFM